MEKIRDDNIPISNERVFIDWRETFTGWGNLKHFTLQDKQLTVEYLDKVNPSKVISKKSQVLSDVDYSNLINVLTIYKDLLSTKEVFYIGPIDAPRQIITYRFQDKFNDKGVSSLFANDGSKRSSEAGRLFYEIIERYIR